jgi:hypothetical protein
VVVIADHHRFQLEIRVKDMRDHRHAEIILVTHGTTWIQYQVEKRNRRSFWAAPIFLELYSASQIGRDKWDIRRDDIFPSE